MDSMRSFLLATFLVAAVAAPQAIARDTTLHLDKKDVLDPSSSSATLDGSVRFYFEGEATPKVLADHGLARTSKKTNGAGKSDEEACRWAALSAFKALEAKAKQIGANAVIGIRSNYGNVVWTSATQYECHAGALMSGVAFTGHYAKIAER
jgi:uncharacterized protein YbjQ (UPF0145 family)